MPVPRKCRALIWRQPSFACLQFGQDVVHVFTGAALFQEVNGGAEPERRRQLGTHPHSADIPIVYPISVFGSSTPPTPASVRALPVLLPAYSGT